MSEWGLGLGIAGAGGVAGALGSVLGAQSQNRAARRAQDLNRSEQAAHARRLGSMFLGWPGYDDFLLATRDRAGYRWAHQGQPHNTPTEAMYAAGAGRFFANHPSVESVLQSSGARYLGDLEGLLARERQRTQQLDQMAGQAEGFGSDLEGRQSATIRRDSDRQLRAMNQVTQAQLGWMGPSSLVANQMAGNATQVGYQTNDALLAAAKAAVDRLLLARGARMTQLGQRYGLEGQLEQNVAGARQNASMAPAAALQALLSGNAFQPFQASPAAYSPYSPAGNGLGTLGQGLAGIGGYLIGQQPTGSRATQNPQPGLGGFVGGSTGGNWFSGFR